MKIDIKDNSEGGNIKRCEFPGDSKFLGSEENREDMKIFIRKEILDKVDRFLSSDLQNELGGVLIGQECISGNNEKFILIENYIEAEHSNSSLSRLTFTHETWDHINKVLERDFSNMKILGWFHSHPGHTVFLSNYDMFIQENFFDMSYMVAYVYDPTINDRGFFLWRDEKIVKADGFHIYDIKPFGDTILVNSPVDESDFEPEGIEKISSDESKYGKILGPEFKNLVVIVLLLLTLLILLLMIYNYYDLKQKALLKEQYVKDLAELRSENKKLSELLNSYIIDNQFKKSLVSSDIMNNETPPVSKGMDAAGNQGTSLNTGTNTNIAETQNQNAGSNSNSGTKTNTAIENKTEPPKQESNNIVTVYTVKNGDTLEKISNQFYKSRAGIDLLMKHNNIKNRADIKIGQKLEIPEGKF